MTRNNNDKSLMLIQDREQLRAAEAVVDAALWCQSVKGPISLSAADRDFLVKLIKANPELTGSLFKGSGLTLR